MISNELESVRRFDLLFRLSIDTLQMFFESSKQALRPIQLMTQLYILVE